MCFFPTDDHIVRILTRSRRNAQLVFPGKKVIDFFLIFKFPIEYMRRNPPSISHDKFIVLFVFFYS